MTMRVIAAEIPEVLIIEPKVFEDARGYFLEAWSQRDFDENVYPVRFVQDNESRSSYGVVRGLHFQKGKNAQAKLVSVVSGTVLDVAVDIRRGSPTFGRYAAVELSGDNHRQLFIPKGFAHGFSVLSDTAVFRYKCDNFYCTEAEAGIAYNDPAIGIDWRIPSDSIVLSTKDLSRPLLSEAEELFEYCENANNICVRQ